MEELQKELLKKRYQKYQKDKNQLLQNSVMLFMIMQNSKECQEQIFSRNKLQYDLEYIFNAKSKTSDVVKKLDFYLKEQYDERMDQQNNQLQNQAINDEEIKIVEHQDKNDETKILDEDLNNKVFSQQENNKSSFKQNSPIQSEFERNNKRKINELYSEEQQMIQFEETLEKKIKLDQSDTDLINIEKQSIKNPIEDCQIENNQSPQQINQDKQQQNEKQEESLNYFNEIIQQGQDKNKENQIVEREMQEEQEKKEGNNYNDEYKLKQEQIIDNQLLGENVQDHHQQQNQIINNINLGYQHNSEEIKQDVKQHEDIKMLVKQENQLIQEQNKEINEQIGDSFIEEKKQQQKNQEQINKNNQKSESENNQNQTQVVQIEKIKIQQEQEQEQAVKIQYELEVISQEQEIKENEQSITEQSLISSQQQHEQQINTLKMQQQNLQKNENQTTDSVENIQSQILKNFENQTQEDNKSNQNLQKSTNFLEDKDEIETKVAQISVEFINENKYDGIKCEGKEITSKNIIDNQIQNDSYNHLLYQNHDSDNKLLKDDDKKSEENGDTERKKAVQGDQMDSIMHLNKVKVDDEKDKNPSVENNIKENEEQIINKIENENGKTQEDVTNEENDKYINKQTEIQSLKDENIEESSHTEQIKKPDHDIMHQNNEESEVTPLIIQQKQEKNEILAQQECNIIVEQKKDQVYDDEKNQNLQSLSEKLEEQNDQNIIEQKPEENQIEKMEIEKDINNIVNQNDFIDDKQKIKQKEEMLLIQNEKTQEIKQDQQEQMQIEEINNQKFEGLSNNDEVKQQNEISNNQQQAIIVLEEDEEIQSSKQNKKQIEYGNQENQLQSMNGQLKIYKHQDLQNSATKVINEEKIKEHSLSEKIKEQKNKLNTIDIEQENLQINGSEVLYLYSIDFFYRSKLYLEKIEERKREEKRMQAETLLAQTISLKKQKEISQANKQNENKLKKSKEEKIKNGIESRHAEFNNLNHDTINQQLQKQQERNKISSTSQNPTFLPHEIKNSLASKVPPYPQEVSKSLQSNKGQADKQLMNSQIQQNQIKQNTHEIKKGGFNQQQVNKDTKIIPNQDPKQLNISQQNTQSPNKIIESQQKVKNLVEVDKQSKSIQQKNNNNQNQQNQIKQNQQLFKDKEIQQPKSKTQWNKTTPAEKNYRHQSSQIIISNQNTNTLNNNNQNSNNKGTIKNANKSTIVNKLDVIEVKSSDDEDVKELQRNESASKNSIRNQLEANRKRVENIEDDDNISCELLEIKDQKILNKEIQQQRNQVEMQQNMIFNIDDESNSIQETSKQQMIEKNQYNTNKPYLNQSKKQINPSAQRYKQSDEEDQIHSQKHPGGAAQNHYMMPSGMPPFMHDPSQSNYFQQEQMYLMQQNQGRSNGPVMGGNPAHVNQSFYAHSHQYPPYSSQAHSLSHGSGQPNPYPSLHPNLGYPQPGNPYYNKAYSAANQIPGRPNIPPHISQQGNQQLRMQSQNDESLGDQEQAYQMMQQKNRELNIKDSQIKEKHNTSAQEESVSEDSQIRVQNVPHPHKSTSVHQIAQQQQPNLKKLQQPPHPSQANPGFYGHMGYQNFHAGQFSGQPPHPHHPAYAAMYGQEMAGFMNHPNFAYPHRPYPYQNIGKMYPNQHHASGDKEGKANQGRWQPN